MTMNANKIGGLILILIEFGFFVTTLIFLILCKNINNQIPFLYGSWWFMTIEFYVFIAVLSYKIWNNLSIIKYCALLDEIVIFIFLIVTIAQFSSLIIFLDCFGDKFEIFVTFNFLIFMFGFIFKIIYHALLLTDLNQTNQESVPGMQYLFSTRSLLFFCGLLILSFLIILDISNLNKSMLGFSLFFTYLNYSIIIIGIILNKCKYDCVILQGILVELNKLINVFCICFYTVNIYNVFCCTFKNTNDLIFLHKPFLTIYLIVSLIIFCSLIIYHKYINYKYNKNLKTNIPIPMNIINLNPE